MEEVDGEQKLLKPAQKLKDCIEKTYKVELQSSDKFVSCHVRRTQRNNQKIQFLYRTYPNFNPVSIQKEK